MLEYLCRMLSSQIRYLRSPKQGTYDSIAPEPVGRCFGDAVKRIAINPFPDLTPPPLISVSTYIRSDCTIGNKGIINLA